MIKLLPVVLFMLITSVAFAQGSGPSGYPSDPAVLAKLDQAAVLQREAYRHLEKKEWTLCVSKSEQAFALLENVGFPAYSENYWYLAQAQTALGNKEAASEAYRQAVRWKVEGDISVGSATKVLPDYIAFLVSEYRYDDAKAVYYALLRNLPDNKKPSQMGTEPYPFLVVFDPDPNGDYWEFTPERVVLAAQLVSSGFGGEEFIALLDQAETVFPGWCFPAVYKALKGSDEVDDVLIAQAKTLAKTQRERDWIDGATFWFKADYFERDEPDFPVRIDANSERKKISFLETARLQLVENHSAVSCGKTSGF